MTNCELCGKQGTQRAMIEGTELIVCQDCTKYGKILPSPSRYAKPATIRKTPSVQPVYAVVSDYAKRIRDTRAKSGLTQKEFALKINQKESVLQHWETGTNEPDIDTARKLEKTLHIALLEERTTPAPQITEKKKTPHSLTIGDILKVK